MQVLTNQLSIRNYTVSTAANGEEALGIVEKGKPDLVLLDVMMPRMSGYEVCERLRERYPANELPVILLTAKNRVDDLVLGFSAGANDYLTKPFSKAELLARVRSHLKIARMNVSYGRFVPHEFLRLLERGDIMEVELGDHMQTNMSVLFSDIRSFTGLSESMSPEENFSFINSYLNRMGPVVRERRGFIDKFIGDAIMALFPEGADDAVGAAIDMLRALPEYNRSRTGKGEIRIGIGIGIHTGPLMLGTIGESGRMDSTVIGDTVNLASRLEDLTKAYGASLLVTGETVDSMADRGKYFLRFLDVVTVRGKSRSARIYEVFDADDSELRQSKLETRREFEKGVEAFLQEDLHRARGFFESLRKRCFRETVNRFGKGQGWSMAGLAPYAKQENGNSCHGLRAKRKEDSPGQNRREGWRKRKIPESESSAAVLKGRQ